jgi:hypothetical protein
MKPIFPRKDVPQSIACDVSERRIDVDETSLLINQSYTIRGFMEDREKGLSPFLITPQLALTPFLFFLIQ